MQAWPILLGLLASLFFAMAGFFQQRAARSTERSGHGALSGLSALMARLLRSRTWLLGWCVNLGGFAAQAVALHLGSVAAVQPLLATQLLFAVLLSCRELRRWPLATDWAAGLAICAGLIVLLTTEGGSAETGTPDRGRILVAVGAVALLVLALLTVARRLRPSALNVLASGTAALCFALTAVFIKLTGDDLIHRGVAYTAGDWVGYALAASTLLGLVLAQAAYANGPLPWAMATQNSVNPVASFALGVLAFPTQVPTDPAHLAGLGAAAVLLVLGAYGLAHSPSAKLWRRRDDDVPASPEPAPVH